jgi:hypothetical protein
VAAAPQVLYREFLFPNRRRGRLSRPLTDAFDVLLVIPEKNVVQVQKYFHAVSMIQRAHDSTGALSPGTAPGQIPERLPESDPESRDRLLHGVPFVVWRRLKLKLSFNVHPGNAII